MRLSAAIALLLALVLAACPKSAPTFDPKTRWATPEDGDAAARGRFDEARVRFERDEVEGAAQEFEAIAREYPADPIAPHARLYAGLAAYKGGDAAAAIAALEPLTAPGAADAELCRRASFTLGLAYAAAGRPADALRVLEPFAATIAPGDDATELWAALAAAYDAGGQVARALTAYDRFYPRATLAERAHIRARVAALVAGVRTPDLAALAGEVPGGGVAAALVAERRAAVACAAGDEDTASRLLADAAAARAAADLPPASACGSEGVRPDLVGVLVPQTGKRRLVGEAALRGVSVATGALEGPSDNVAFGAQVGDAGESAASAVAGLEALAAAGVIAVIGPLDRDGAEAAATRAASLGVPLVSLDVGDAPLGPAGTFRIVVDLDTRARVLALRAREAGVREVAILRPSIAYGRRAADAFTAQFEKLGGRVVVTVDYAKEATSFVEPVKKLSGLTFDAVFIPDTAARLELIAPQLAAADLVSAPPGAKKPKRGRNVLLLSTAEGLTPTFLRSSGRYAVGAVLAPGFYPDDADAVIGPYARSFRAAFGTEPTIYDAYAFDAIACVRAAVVGGATTRGGMAAALGRVRVRGLTGPRISFDAKRGRADAGFLYQVQALPNGEFVIRLAEVDDLYFGAGGAAPARP